MTLSDGKKLAHVVWLDLQGCLNRCLLSKMEGGAADMKSFERLSTLPLRLLLRLCCQLGVIPAEAQDAPHKLPNLPVKATPHTADGHPDFSGMWIEGYLTSDSYFDNPYPYTPEAAKKVRELYRAGDTDPLLHCLPYGYPRNLGGAHPIQVIQTPGQVAILYERDTTFRVFPTDGRPHWEGADPSYMGDSVGHWEGDTLIVDITSFNDISWLPSGEGTGAFHSDALHVVEKYTRKDSNNMDIAMTFEDPKVFTRPYNTVHHMHLVPDEHFYEGRNLHQ